MIRELLLGVIFIFAPSIIYVGNKLSVGVSCQDSSDKNCVTEPTARYPTMVRYPVSEVKTGISKRPESTVRAGTEFIKSKIPKNNDPENTNCVAVPSTVVNEESILKQFPEVRRVRYCAHDGFYRYKANYAHLNSLLKDGIKDVCNFSINFCQYIIRMYR